MLRALDWLVGGFWAGFCEFFAGVGQEFNVSLKGNKVYYDMGEGPVLDSRYYSKTKARRRLTAMRREFPYLEGKIWLDDSDGGRQLA